MPEDDVPMLTLAVLREIRDEVKRTNDRLDQTNDRLDRLERRQTETEVRLSTELVAVASAVRDLSALLREDRAFRAKVEEHDQRIAALEKKVG